MGIDYNGDGMHKQSILEQPNITNVESNTMGWQLPLAIIAALMAPFLLWPVEQLLPYPVVIEELYKGGLVYLVFLGTKQRRIQWVFLVAIAFAVSETMFYLVSALQDLAWGDWGWRWVTTVPMHLLTFLVHYTGMVLGAWPVALLAAMGIHWGFNNRV